MASSPWCPAHGIQPVAPSLSATLEAFWKRQGAEVQGDRTAQPGIALLVRCCGGPSRPAMTR